MSAAPRDLLGRPAPEAARVIALDYLDAAAEALERLADPDDAEALHDFRVALRRMRSCLRAYRPFFKGSVPRKLRRQLRELAAATTVGRDTEVQLAWLAKQRQKKQRLSPRQKPGLAWLVQRLEQRRQAAYEHIRGQIAADFVRLHRRLARRLSTYQAPVRRDSTGGVPSFAHATAELVRAFAADLDQHLERVRSPADETEAHQARISAKRLRYLLEPLRGQLAGCDAVIARIKELQQVLGDMHDAMVLAAEIRPALETAAAERARQVHDLALSDQPPASRPGRDARPGLLALAQLVKQRRERLFKRLEAEWLGGRASDFFAQLEAMARSLDAAIGDDLDHERIYLVRALPERAASAEPVQVEDGWLPGQQIEEHVRRVSGREGKRCYRMVRARDGTVVEEIPDPIFLALWPLTAGRRVRFECYSVRDKSSGSSWEIRRLRDRERELWVAVIRTASEDATLELPDWLEPYVTREVTREPEFGLRALAR